VPPVSADREPRYAWPSNVSRLSAQLFGLGANVCPLLPEAALMCAVLEDAFFCFQKQFESENLRVKRTAQEAEEWFFSTDPRWLFSFLSICNVLGLEPEYIRNKLKHWSPSPVDIRQRKI
jgi:hypothetical protein